MYNKIFSILTLVFLFACSTTTSYQGAVVHNTDNKYGDVQDNALFLVDLKSDALFIEQMSVLTLDKQMAYSKKVYDLAEELKKDYSDFQFKLNVLALKKNVKLPDQTRPEYKEAYQEAFDTDDAVKFDQLFIDHVELANDSLLMRLNRYTEEGSDDAILKFIKNQTGIAERTDSQLNMIKKELIEEEGETK
jgi:predicted outer membrane protein